jgi:hypothetical protein
LGKSIQSDYSERVSGTLFFADIGKNSFPGIFTDIGKNLSL